MDFFILSVSRTKYYSDEQSLLFILMLVPEMLRSIRARLVRVENNNIRRKQMKQKQINYTVEELKDKVLHYDSAMTEAYEVRDGNLYLMYKDLRDIFLERLYTAQRSKKCVTQNSAK